ncbi:MAG: hypothetical protein ACKOAY_11535 [Haliscomenobacter sp.]
MAANPINPDNNQPPILGSWRRVYLVLLLCQVLLMLAFYVFMRLFS